MTPDKRKLDRGFFLFKISGLSLGVKARMPTAVARLLNAVMEELRSPVAPFPVDHLRVKLLAIFLGLINLLALTYGVFFENTSALGTVLTVVCLVLTALLTAGQWVSARYAVPYGTWMRPLFFLQLALVGPLRYLLDPSPVTESLMLAGVLLYFIHGVDVRICAGDLAVGFVIAFILGRFLGTDINVAAFLFLALICGIAGLLMMAKEVHLRRERMRTIRTLIGVMAHELRTPLVTINMSAELLEALVKDGPEADRSGLLLDRLRGSVRYMHSIIDHQIANSGVASNQGETELINLGDLLREIHEEFPYRKEEERNSVVLNVAGKVMIRCSPTIMRQVITNLLKNAITAVAKTDQPFTKGDVTLSVRTAGKEVILQVEDRGIGIAPGDQSRIFDPFFSSTPKATHGLGLTQVREAVHFMGGMLSLQSELGHGTLFTARFPSEMV